jgi:hypothetical protein
MRLRSGGDGYPFNAENDDISTIFTTAHNIRSGIEVKLSDILRVRGGYAFYGSPYKLGEMNSGANYTIISGGLGFIWDNSYLDVAYRVNTIKTKQDLYTIPENWYVNNGWTNSAYPTNVTKTSRGEFLVTLGFSMGNYY